MTNNPWSDTIEAQQPSAKPEWLTEDLEKQLRIRSYPINQDGMLMLWKESKEHLDMIKKTEMQYRKICAVFLVPSKIEGITTVELGNDFKAKVNHKYNYDLKKVDNNSLWESLKKIRAVGNIGPVIADRLVSWTPNFLKTEYNELLDSAEKGNEQAKQILKIVNDEMLTITPAAPELKIVEPKAKKEKK